MRRIQRLVNNMDAELKDAKEYALNYLECKADNMMSDANKYKEMATDEVKHSNLLHEMIIAEISKIKNVYQSPVEMDEMWNFEHRKYIESVADIKQLLTM